MYATSRGFSRGSSTRTIQNAIAFLPMKRQLHRSFEQHRPNEGPFGVPSGPNDGAARGVCVRYRPWRIHQQRRGVQSCVAPVCGCVIPRPIRFCVPVVVSPNTTGVSAAALVLNLECSRSACASTGSPRVLAPVRPILRPTVPPKFERTLRCLSHCRHRQHGASSALALAPGELASNRRTVPAT